jgi:hypothetical protein
VTPETPKTQPQPTLPPQIQVSFADVLAGRAYLRIPLAGKLLLAHWAGAPWSDKDDNACLHALQVEVLSRKEREKIVHGASRLGKSVLGGCDALVATMLPHRKPAVVADRYDHVAHEYQYLYQGMRRLFAGHSQAFKRLAFRNQMNYHEYECDTIWGSRTIGISVQSDEGAQLLGRELTDVICGEGSHIPVDIFNTKLLRALDGALMQRSHGANQEIGSLSIYTTPKGYEGCSAHEWERVKKQTKNQPEKLHYGNAPWAKTVWVREASIYENPAYNREVADARRETLDKRAFAEQYLGKMTFASGRVWRSFDEDKHAVAMPPAEYIRTMRLGLGLDTGAYTGIVLGGIGRDRKKWILGEVYTEKIPGGIYSSLDLAEEMLHEILDPVFGGPTIRTILDTILFTVNIDPASQHKPEITDRWDVALSGPGTPDQKSVLSTTDLVDKWFQADELFIVDSCTYTIDQIRKYVWKQMKAPTSAGAPVIREPSKVYDHLCDALRFLLVPLADFGPLDVPPPVLTWAEQWNARQKEMAFGPLNRALAVGAQRDEMLGRTVLAPPRPARRGLVIQEETRP